MAYDPKAGERRGLAPQAWPDEVADLLLEPERRSRTVAATAITPARRGIGGPSQRPLTRTPAGPPSPPRATLPTPLARSPALWGGIGFLLGIVFWHWIGFWGFVSAAVWPATSHQRPDARLQTENSDGRRPTDR